MQYDVEQLKIELVDLKSRKEIFSAQMNQVIGAIAVVEQMIVNLTNPTKADETKKVEEPRIEELKVEEKISEEPTEIKETKKPRGRKRIAE